MAIRILLCLALPLTLLVPAAAGEYNLVANGGFETVEQGDRPAIWSVHQGHVVETAKHSGRRALRITGPGSAIQDCWRAAPGRTYTCSAWIDLKDVRPAEAPGYAYLAVYQYDHRKRLIAYRDFMHGTGTEAWRRYTYTFTVVENARYVSVRAGLFRAEGTVYVDDVVLVEGKTAPESAEGLPEIPVPKDIGRGRIAILKDDIPAGGAASDPDYLADVLRAEGYAVTLLGCDGLCDPGRFDRTLFELLILPYGGSFPMKAEATLQRFLMGGGDFICMGGYAFDHLLTKKDGRWVPYTYDLDAADSPELVANPGFESAEGWAPTTPRFARLVTDRPHSGRQCAHVALDEPNSVSWRQEVPVEVGKEYRFSAWLRTENVVPGQQHGFGYLAVYQYDKDDKLTDFHDVTQLKGTHDWRQVRYTFAPRGATVKARLIGGLYAASGQVWIDDVGLRTVPPRVCINTRHGDPRDGLNTLDTQIGVFDPSYRLRRVAYARAAPGQFVLDPGLRIDGPLEGFAASGVTGYDNMRWASLLMAHDRYGRRRGSVAAMMRNYNGVYRRSTWAVFGATNRDLFPRGDEKMRTALVDLVGSMMDETYLHNLETDLACYRSGETGAASVAISNFGWKDRSFQVQFSLVPTGGKAAFEPTSDALALKPVAITVPAGRTEISKRRFGLKKPASDFYVVRADLIEEGKVIDRVRTGFAIMNPDAIHAGPSVEMRDNYWLVRGKAHVLLATDTYSNMFRSKQHNPLTWARDIRKCADFGIAVFENLQVNATAFDPPYRAPKDWLRQVDAMVQLCQANDSIYLPCLLCGHNTVVSDDDLKAQAGYSRAYAERYRNVPGIAYYVNGDLRFQWIDSPDIKRLWNEFLKAKYGTDEKLCDAWRLAPPEKLLGNLDVDKRRGAAGWADIRACDAHEFKMRLVERWVRAQHEACRAGDPDRPTTIEYYSKPFGGIDLRRSIDGLDLGNIGFFRPPGEDLADLPSVLKLNDLRLIGKGLSVGEFGVKTHPAWSREEGYELSTYHVTRTEAEQNRLFLTLPHYVLGMGGCKMHNWCWRDANERVFPWGLNYPCDVVEKDCLRVYRNVGLLFRQFEPVYRPPQVVLLVPDRHMLGGSAARVQRAVLTAMDTLVDLHVDFAPLGEAHIDKLPKGTTAILYPVPFSIPDKVYATLKDFSAKGGHLYLSGDFAYDSIRKRTKPERLKELAGVEFPAPKGVYGRPEGEPPVVEKGTVMMRTDPIELTEERDSPALRRLYLRFLDTAGIAREPVLPDDPDVHVMTLPTRDGGGVTTLVNAHMSETKRVRYGEGVEMSLAPLQPGLILRNANGDVTAIEASGRFALDGKPVVEGPGHFMLFSTDGADVRRSGRIVFMPFDTGTYRITLSDGLARPQVSIGEVRNAKWVTYESLSPIVTDGKCGIAVDEDRRWCIFLMATAEETPGLAEHVARMLVTP
ncbi:MAG: hypothetical protein GXP25_14295 [Planctomycetes bacterium]|nr:hypothetical protein [Planctomycetota bacterium]